MSGSEGTRASGEAASRPSPPDTPWARSEEEVVRHLGTDPDGGLSPHEVRIRRKRHGPNRLRPRSRKSAWRILADQLRSPIVALLGVAAGASLAFGKWLEGAAIGVALLLNTAIGFFTELRATRSMEALRRLGTTTAKVVRGGDAREVPARALVPGDVVLLEAGDLVPADLRLLEANNLQADESALTGESVPRGKTTDPVDADAPVAERTGMVFRGTAITAGSGRGVVTATGTATELGSVATLAEEAESEETPLEERLARLGQRLIWATAAVGVLVVGAGVLGGKPLLLVLETAIALAVAAIPEGLPVVATIALARGVWRMARRQALVNRLSAVETLGATSVICADKTGTLTENRMAVRCYHLATGEAPFPPSGSSADDRPLLRRALEIGVLCNNASADGEEQEAGVGDPTEVALLRAGAEVGIAREELLDARPEVREVAFDPSTQMMATVHRDGDGLRVAVKGAPEAVLEASRRVAAENGAAPLTPDDRERWRARNAELARQGLRVLALAEKQAPSEDGEVYRDLTLLGLVGLVDPPRPEVRGVLERCRGAGIRVVMVTGDQADTARGVARALDLVEDDEAPVVEGSELTALDSWDDADRERVLGVSVFARVSPKQKLDLVGLHQSTGAIVAMTGDGVNDAPALKKADIGVAMGKRGTQVAREAADMVLKDDRFETIVVAVAYGRIIFDNIRKFIVFLLSGNGSEILVVTLVALTGAPLPLGPLQILYINVIGDVFPALALGVGRGDPAVMARPPRDPSEPVLTRRHWAAVGAWSALLAAAVIGAFAAALGPLGLGPERAVSVSFLTLAFARLWHVFNMREPGSPLLRNEVTGNPYVWAALAAGTGLTLAAALVPGLAGVLRVASPGPSGWALVFGASLLPLLLGQAALLVIRNRPG